MLFFNTEKDLISCEKTCKDLYKVVQDDQTGRSFTCPPFPERVPNITYRQRVFLRKFLPATRKHKKLTHNYLLETLSVEEWRSLIQRILTMFLPQDITGSHEYILRGDTIGVLLELVQATMIDQLERANELCWETCDDGTFPFVSLRYLKLQDKLRSSQSLLVPEDENETYGSTGWRIVSNANSLIEDTLRDKIIRKLAFRAGVIFMTKDVYEFSWASAVQVIMLLLEPVCIQFYDDTQTILFDHEPQQQLTGQKRPLSAVETIHRVAPFSRKVQRQGIWYYVHTPVPKQIEDAASKELLPVSKVYGDVWLVSEGNTKEEELDEACDAYTDDDEEDSSQDYQPLENGKKLGDNSNQTDDGSNGGCVHDSDEDDDNSLYINDPDEAADSSIRSDCSGSS